MPASKVAAASPEFRLQQQILSERLGYSFVKLGMRRAPRSPGIQQQPLAVFPSSHCPLKPHWRKEVARRSDCVDASAARGHDAP